MSGSAATVGSGTATGAASGAMIGGPWGAAGGAAVGFVGSLISANDQANIDEKKAQLAYEQADEVGRREVANDANLRAAAWKNEAEISSASAAQGEGVGIGSMLEVKRQTELQIRLNDEAAAFEQKQLREGGGLEQDLAGATRTAGAFQAAGYGVSLLGRLASPQAGIINYGGTQPLPAFSGG